MDDNKLVSGLWIEPRLSTMERLCIESFLQNGHDFELYLYGDVCGVPDTVKVRDANEILPESILFRNSRNATMAFLERFRFKFLHQKGGWWVNMDLACLKRFNVQAPICFSTEGLDGMRSVAVSPIKSRAGDPFFKMCLDAIEAQLKRGVDTIHWEQFGAHLIRRHVFTHGYGLYLKPPEVFSPIHWSRTFQLVTKQDIAFPERTLACQLWSEVWRRGYLSKNAVYHPDSLYEQLKNRYSVFPEK